MRKFRFLMPFGFLLIAAAFSAIVMLLWNWLMPSIVGLGVISFWQAAGLLILARILFGGFGMGKRMMMGHAMHHHHGQGNPIHDKWMKMTPEERKEFVNRRKRFGFGRHPFDMEEPKEAGSENE